MHFRGSAITVEVRSFVHGGVRPATLAHAQSNSKVTGMRQGGSRQVTSLLFRMVRSLPAALLLLGLGPGCYALQPTTPLADYGRQSWVMENGLPQNTVHALAQTPDGFVWLGTEVGLVRFDGNAFSVFDASSTPALPSGDIRCLLVASDGALWVGTSAGLARLKDGAVTVYTEKEGLPSNDVRALGANPDGSVWVSTEGGDASIGTNHVVEGGCRRSRSRIQRSCLRRNCRAEDSRRPQHRCDAQPRREGAAHRSSDTNCQAARCRCFLLDREGSVWIGTNGGLVRWVNGKLEKLPVTDALASASILSLLEDHEGNLWVGTETSRLDILRDHVSET